jgi:hypothetical protein
MFRGCNLENIIYPMPGSRLDLLTLRTLAEENKVLLLVV